MAEEHPEIGPTVENGSVALQSENLKEVGALVENQNVVNSEKEPTVAEVNGPQILKSEALKSDQIRPATAITTIDDMPINVKTNPPLVEDFKSAEAPAMESCPHCSRTFLQGRLEIHLRCCKPGKPMRKVAPKVTHPISPPKRTKP